MRGRRSAIAQCLHTVRPSSIHCPSNPPIRVLRLHPSASEHRRIAPPPPSIRRALFASLASLKGGEGRGEELNYLPLNELSIFKQTLFSLRTLIVQISYPSVSVRGRAERPRTASCLNSQRVANPRARYNSNRPVPLAVSRTQSIGPVLSSPVFSPAKLYSLVHSLPFFEIHRPRALPPVRHSCFVIPSSLGICHSSFPPSVSGLQGRVGQLFTPKQVNSLFTTGVCVRSS